MICENYLTIYVIFVTTVVSLIDGQNNYSPQRFAIEPSDKTAIVGDTVILPCRVDNKVGTLQWTRDGFGLGTERNLNGFPRYLMIGTDDEGDFSLQINSVSLEDDAVFQCQVGASEGVRGVRSRSASFTVFVAPEPPVIVQARAQGDYLRTTAGMTVELTCEAHGGKPPAELTWLDGEGNPVTTGISYTTQLLSDSKRWNAALKWTFVASKDFDGKKLTCRSENAALKQPRYIQIRTEVKYAPEVHLRVSTGQTQVGDDISFLCEATGNPNQLTYKWFRDEEPIAGDHGSRLTIQKLTKEMNGVVISCEVANSVGTSKAKHTLDIAYGPQFRTPLESVFGVELGQEVKLRCDVDGNPRPDITWLMLGSTHVVNTGPELIIKDMNRDRVGKYVCRASVKGFSEISAQSLVFIKGPPRIRRPYIQYGIDGEAVKIECIIESIPPPTKILWSHNSQIVDVDNNDGYEIVEEPIQVDSTLRSMIVIRKSKLSDFGSYNCSVWNQFGFDSRIITLVQESNFSPLVLTVGIIICGIVFIIASTIIVILCMKRKNKFVDNDCYGNDLKKGQVMSGAANSSANGKHHSAMDSGSSGADSDIKVEIRTASSMSQHWEETDGQQCNETPVNTDIGQVVENIYSYTTQQSQPILFQSIHNDLHQNSNGYIPTYMDYSHDYIPVPSTHIPTTHSLSPTHTQHASIIVSSIDPQRASYAIDPTYGTLLAEHRYRQAPIGYANPYLRTSNQSSVMSTNSSNNNSINNNNNNCNNNQLSAGMYSANQRYITNNGHTGGQSANQLATHV